MPCPARRTYDHIIGMLNAYLLAGHYGLYMEHLPGSVWHIPNQALARCQSTATRCLC
jgi:hypothetical protein